MPNFDAKIRLDYKDIDGLVLDCRHSGLADNGSLWVNQAPSARSLDVGSHRGSSGVANLFDSTKSWRVNQLVGKVAYNLTDGSAGLVVSNTEHEVVTSLSGGTDNDWDTDDEYAITTPRFGNPYQNVVANRPVVSTVGGYKRATFTLASSHFFKIPLTYGFPSGDWTVAVDYIKGAASSNNQTVLGFSNLELIRRNSGGNKGYRHNAVEQTDPGDMDDGAWLLAYHSASAADLYKNGVSELSGSASGASIAAGDPAGYIGCYNGSTKFCEMALRALQVWNRRVSPLEVDFAFQSVSPAGDESQLGRATVGRVEWTDDTATVSRLNPTYVASHKFLQVILPPAGNRRIQIVAMVDGKVWPDTDLGGDLFDLTPIETPAAAPAVYQDSGWSSVFDVVLQDKGHYTYLIQRQDGGAVVLHFDVGRNVA